MATRFPASLLPAEVGGLSSDVVVVVRVIVELVIVYRWLSSNEVTKPAVGKRSF